MLRFFRKNFSSVFLFAFFLSQFCLAERILNERSSVQQEIQWISERHPLYLELLARRLIDPPHWKMGKIHSLWPAGDSWIIPEEFVHRPDIDIHHGYGEECFEHWISAYEYVLKNSSRFPEVNDYLQLHRLSFFNTPGDMFWGYYRYQIWHNFKANQREKLYQILDLSETSQEALNTLFQYGIKSGRGILRTEGDSSWSGKPWSQIHQRSLLYSQDEFERFARHKLLRPEIKKIYSNGIDARFWHPAGKDVPLLLQKLFFKIRTQAYILKKQKNFLPDPVFRKKATLLVSEFYIQLLLIHGLWDGVGRSSKLIRDWALRYLGLQVPAETPINDMEMTAEEYAPLLEQSIQETESFLSEKLLLPTHERPGNCSEIFI